MSSDAKQCEVVSLTQIKVFSAMKQMPTESGIRVTHPHTGFDSHTDHERERERERERESESKNTLLVPVSTREKIFLSKKNSFVSPFRFLSGTAWCCSRGADGVVVGRCSQKGSHALFFGGPVHRQLWACFFLLSPTHTGEQLFLLEIHRLACPLEHRPPKNNACEPLLPPL